ncbi:MAG: hypothetical protein Q4D14_04455, partial [Bacteroidales bacterium]|nr:hypothetical protein [Bacteroidales bacterium]
ECVMSGAVDNGDLYILTTTSNTTTVNYYTRFYYSDARIYKNGQLIHEITNIRNPRDLFVIGGDCYFLAVDMEDKTFGLWKNEDRIHEYGYSDEVKVFEDMEKDFYYIFQQNLVFSLK